MSKTVNSLSENQTRNCSSWNRFLWVSRINSWSNWRHMKKGAYRRIIGRLKPQCWQLRSVDYNACLLCFFPVHIFTAWVQKICYITFCHKSITVPQGWMSNKDHVLLPVFPALMYLHQIWCFLIKLWCKVFFAFLQGKRWKKGVFKKWFPTDFKICWCFFLLIIYQKRTKRFDVVFSENLMFFKALLLGIRVAP